MSPIASGPLFQSSFSHWKWKCILFVFTFSRRFNMSAFLFPSQYLQKVNCTLQTEGFLLRCSSTANQKRERQTSSIKYCCVRFQYIWSILNPQIIQNDYIWIHYQEAVWSGAVITRLGLRKFWFLIPALPMSQCNTLDMLLNLSPHICKIGTITSWRIRFQGYSTIRGLVNDCAVIWTCKVMWEDMREDKCILWELHDTHPSKHATPHSSIVSSHICVPSSYYGYLNSSTLPE